MNDAYSLSAFRGCDAHGQEHGINYAAVTEAHGADAVTAMIAAGCSGVVLMRTGSCGCGCGELASPGSRFLPHHYARTIRRAVDSRLVPCSRCQKRVRPRRDGTLGTHFATSSRFGEHFRCPGGGLPPLARTPGRGRRVTVSVDVVLPDGWDIPRLKAEAGQALRDRMQELLVVSVDVNEAS